MELDFGAIKSLRKNNKGVVAIEMAIVLPILILIIAAVLEFGLYFLKSQAASRAVSTASISLQQDHGAVNSASTKTTMQNNGLGMMNLAAMPNFVCAKAYATSSAASSGSCNAGDWETSEPTGVTVGSPYWIAVRAFAVHTPLTPLRAISGAFPPDIDSRNVVPINTVASNWVDVPISDTNSFDIDNCEYRFRVSGLAGNSVIPGFSNTHWYNAIYKSADAIVNSGWYYLRSGNKQVLHGINESNNETYNATAALGARVTNIQKKCN